METDQKRQSWLVSLGEPTALDWCWLVLATVGALALVVLLAAFFMI
jgi:hypothetical protein